MRLNRVLLLAAVISMAMAAMVFTISCSGDDGKDGSSCTAERKGDEGYSIKCGGVEQGFIPFTGVKGDKGDKGDDGANCTWVAGVTFNCDGHTVNLGGTGGGGSGCSIGQEDKYNVNELVIQCPGAESIYLCAGQVFDKSSYHCYNGTQRDGSTANTGDKNYVAYNAGSVSAISNGFPILDAANFECGSPGAKYDPNKYFCKGTAGQPASDELIELCGAGDFNGTTQFCLQANFKSVVKKCGPTSGSPVSFNANQFCQVPRIITGSGAALSNYTDSLAPYDTTSVGFTTANGLAVKVAPLCGTDQYGSAGLISLYASYSTLSNPSRRLKEISKASFTGGEYWTSTTPGGVGILMANSTSKYYTYGTSICKDGVVLTHCKKNSNDSLYFDAKTQFCRDKASKPTDSLEVVGLCFKSSDPKKAGTYFDGITYQCNTETGEPAKLCGSSYYNDVLEFCYSPTNTVAVKCKDDPTQYNPDLAFCSYGGKLAETPISAGGPVAPDYSTTEAPLEKSVALCGANKLKYNSGSWKWEYCVNRGTANEAVLACGVNEEPEKSAVAGGVVRCKCAAALTTFKDPWTNTCVIVGSTGCAANSAANKVKPDGTCCGNLGTGGTGTGVYASIYLGAATGSTYTCAIQDPGGTDADAPVSCDTGEVRLSKLDATCIPLADCNTNNGGKGTTTLGNGEVVCNDP